MKKVIQTIAVILLLIPVIAVAQKSKKEIINKLDSQYEVYKGIANQLWENPELGYLEENSSILLQLVY